MGCLFVVSSCKMLKLTADGFMLFWCSVVGTVSSKKSTNALGKAEEECFIINVDVNITSSKIY